MPVTQYLISGKTEDRSQKTEVPDFLGSCHELYRITILLASLRTYMLKYKDYIGKVHYSPEGGVFFGKIEGIDDLITFEGNNVDQLKSSFQEAVEDYLEICESLGKAL